MESYVSARGRATAIKVLTIIQLVVVGLVIPLSVIGLGQLGEDSLALTVAGGLEVLEGLLFLAAGIVFLTWVYRSIANLPALGSMSCRFTPGAAVWGFIIPFLNLVRGHQVMSTVWRESQPPAVGENGFYLPRSSGVVSLWWALFLVMTIGDRIIARWNPVGLDEARSLLIFDLVINIVTFACGVMFFMMVRATQSRQDAQWDDLVRQRNVPKPSADQLR
jgi:hypothetical protein